jgi:MFS family permease
MRRRRVGGSTDWHLILRVFLPFVAAYYLSFLFRTINATVAGSLTSEFGLSAGDLGLLTSVYYLTFAAAQIPIGILLDRYGPGLIQSAVMIAAALGAALFAVSDNFWLLLGGRALIGLGVAASLTAGLKALVLWFPCERIPLLNGLMIMLGALGALTATLPAEFLLVSMGWRALFVLLAIASAGCALFIYFVVPEVSAAMSVGGGPTPNSLRTIYADPRFWRLAPLSAACIGTAWALQGLWAAPWLGDVERLDRSGLLWHLLIMAIALSLGGLLWGLAVDRARRCGTGPRTLLGLVATVFIVAQLALILRLPLPSYVPWIVVATVGAGTVLSYAILAEYFPKELAGRANAALNLFHIGGAFVVQYMTGLVLQLWDPTNGHYPEIAYQTAFAFNVGLQIVAGVWFALTWILKRRGEGNELDAFLPQAAARIRTWGRRLFLQDRESTR